MEWMNKVTDVLSQVMDPRSVRRQYPAKPAAAWIFDANEKKEETKSVSDIIKGTLARDFYTTEQSPVENAAEEEEGIKLDRRLTAMRLSESSSSIDGGGAEADLALRRQSADEAVESAARSHEQPSERPEAREKKLSQKGTIHICVHNNARIVEKRKTAQRLRFLSLVFLFNPIAARRGEARPGQLLVVAITDTL